MFSILEGRIAIIEGLAMSKKGTGFFNVIASALAAAFGVQKREKLERDFQQGRPAHFIIAGIVGTLLFILTLVAIVHFVLGNTAT